jgi:hypothetical protein
MCGCNSGKVAEPEPKFEVKYPDGKKEVVTGEHAAKVLVTMGPSGTSYSRY